MSYTRHVADFTVGERRLCFFGHVMARADPKKDHHPVIGASLQPPSHWRRPCGRPHTSWLRATDTDVYSQSTSGSTQPTERPVAARSGNVSSTRQNSVVGTPL